MPFDKLHNLLWKNPNDVDQVRALIDKNPNALKEKDQNGKLPLHCAAQEGASVVVIQLLIKEYPDAVKEKDNVGNLPLHYATYKGASMEVMQLLIKEYPEAVKEKDEDGDLPLHYAVENGASMEVIQLLVKEYPDTVKEKDQYGNLPLHCATYKGASMEVMQLLIKEYPEAVKEKDEDGDLPLHYAVENGASMEVIQLLIKEYPDAMKEKDNYGNLPLHVAVEKGVSMEVIQLLIKEYPDAMKEKMNGGNLPLHKAIEKGASVGSLQLILKAHPQAAKEKMKDKRLPIEVYLENEDAGDLVLELLKADMPVDIEDGMPVEHSRSWTTCVSSSTTTLTAAVRQVLCNDEGGGGYGKYIHALADVRDAEDRTALAAASSGARTEIYKYLLFCSRYKLREGPPEHITGTSALFRAQDFDEKANYGVIFDKADTDKSGNLDEEELNTIAGSIGLDPDLFLKGSDKKTVSKEDFVAICKRQLGDGPREVVIKFMRNKDHWERETNARADYKLNPKYVVSALRNIPSQTEIAKAVERGDGGLAAIEKKFLEGIKPGKYAIIMNAAERNLQQILFQEQPKIDAVRDMLRHVFEAVQHLHEKKLIHGDIKMVNIVRFRIDNKLRLIDLDACARIAQIGEVEESFAGAKFSSAILPPEMIERIETKEKLEAFKKYWKAENDKDLYEKVKPKPYKKRGVLKGHYVVKSFRTKDGQPVHNGLPYDLVRASKSIDAWSLGVLAFTLLTGETLIPSTFVDDCTSGAAMDVLYSWGTQPDVLSELFKKIHDDAARDLVRQLLQYEPAERPTVDQLLKTHPFFNSQSGVLLEKLEDMDTKLELAAMNRQDDRALLEKMDANIVLIKQLSVESKSEICRTRHVLMKGIYEATEIDAPTTFTVLNEKLPSANLPSVETKNQTLDIIAKEDASGIRLKTEITSVTISAEGADIALEGDFKEHHEKFQTGMKWAKRIKKIGSKVAAGEVGKAFDIIKEGIKDLIVGDEMYLYLIDELTGEPVQADGWPLIITKPSEVVPKLLPLMQLGLRGISVMNGVAGVATFFGVPVPKISQAVTKGAQESVELLKKESSVEEFGVVHKEVKGGDEEQKSVRGASLRDFMDFLKENDPGWKEGKRGNFAGLQRIGDPEDGGALWTALTDRDEIENALEVRAKQRKLEQLKHNEYIKQTAKREVDLEEGEENKVEIPEENTGSTAKTEIQSKHSVAVVNSEEIAEGNAVDSVANSAGNACCTII